MSYSNYSLLSCFESDMVIFIRIQEVRTGASLWFLKTAPLVFLVPQHHFNASLSTLCTKSTSTSTLRLEAKATSGRVFQWSHNLLRK